MKTETFMMAVASSMLFLTILAARDTDAQRPSDRRGPRPQDGEEVKRSQTNESKEKKTEQVTAIVDGDVYTVSAGVIRRSTVLIRDNKIAEVGQDVEVPEGATIVDAKGKYITPGFIAMDMSRIGLQTSTSRNNKPVDSLDPFDREMKLALGVGITTGCVQIRGEGRGSRRRTPEERFLGLDSHEEVLPDDFHLDFGLPDKSVCPCCGLSILPTEPITPTRPSTPTVQRQVVLKMSYGQLASMLISETPVYGMSQGGLTGALNLHNWRQSIEKAKQYVKDQEQHEQAVKEGKKENPPRKSVSDELIKLVKKEIYLRVRADTLDEIRNMIALAEELDYKLMLDGVVEGWLAAEQLSEARVPVVLTPRRRRTPAFGKEDSTGSSIESSGIFDRAGVPFALSTLSSSISLNGLAGRDLTSLPLEAAFAVRGGSSEKTALEALTIVPAQMLGLADRIGSIERGKDADLLVLNGPPLDYRTYVETAWVNGRICYERTRDRVYPVFDR